MSCEQIRELVVDELIAGVPDEQRRAIADHFEGCAGCDRWARRQRELWRDLEFVAALRAPTDGLDRLEARVAQEFGSRVPTAATAPLAPPSRTNGLRRAALVILALAVGAAGGATFAPLIMPGRVPTPPSGETLRDPQLSPGDPGTTVERPRFVLLFYDVSEDPEARAKFAEDLFNWKQELNQGGALVGGLDLSDVVAWAGAGSSEEIGSRRVSHYVTIEAGDLGQAREIAATSPASAYEGVIEVRPLQ